MGVNGCQWVSMDVNSLPQVLRLQGLSLTPPPPRPSPLTPIDPGSGFMLLRELSLRGAGSGVTDWFLWRILNSSSRLRSLDLSGCSRVTPPGLMALPAELEVLSLALPGGSEQFLAPPYGSSKVTCRWGRSLRELDLSGRQFNERDLAEAMAALGPQAPLRALNMANTRVSARALSVLLSSCPHLSFLDLSSCRRLPRGTKRAHRGRSQVRRCLSPPLRRPAPNKEPPNEEPPNVELDQ
uniref:Uncharacterized protein n=1 Tax=Melopsittacus undulatus TaxID=13146 RepID=A0A8V5H1I5_MELUD